MLTGLDVFQRVMTVNPAAMGHEPPQLASSPSFCRRIPAAATCPTHNSPPVTNQRNWRARFGVKWTCPVSLLSGIGEHHAAFKEVTVKLAASIAPFSLQSSARSAHAELDRFRCFADREPEPSYFSLWCDSAEQGVQPCDSTGRDRLFHGRDCHRG